MKKTIALLATLLRTLADELEEFRDQPETPAAEKPKRGRKAAEPAPTAAAEPVQEVLAEPPQETAGLPLEELQALIQPHIKAAQGKLVKAIITKHGGTSLSTIPAANHAAFAEEIEALVY
jgi:hypothetical protein